MDIQFLGHSCFKLKGKKAVVLTDPYHNSIGLELKKQSADIVTVSHQHEDHNAVEKVTGTARREVPYVISAPGEYEIEGVGVFGWGSFHDQSKGEERGENTIFVIHIDGIRVAHLGDLGHLLTESLIKDLGEIDVLLMPVGGHYTINAAQAREVMNQISPSIVIPMHYRTPQHDQVTFGALTDLQQSLDQMGLDDAVEQETKLSVNQGQLPEETEVHVLSV